MTIKEIVASANNLAIDFMQITHDITMVATWQVNWLDADVGLVIATIIVYYLLIRLAGTAIALIAKATIAVFTDLEIFLAVISVILYFSVLIGSCLVLILILHFLVGGRDNALPGMFLFIIGVYGFWFRYDLIIERGKRLLKKALRLKNPTTTGDEG